MGYGARARQVPAKGARTISDVDIYKVLMMGNTERGIAKTHKEIYSMTDFERVAGGFVSSKYCAYVADRFFKTLNTGVNVEMILRSYVASDAVQAAKVLNDSSAVPVKAYDLKAGYKGLTDKSAFGNKIAFKISKQFNYISKPTDDTTATASTTVTLDSCEGWEVGYFGKIVDTGIAPKTAYFIVTVVDKVAKTLTFLTLGNVTKYDKTSTLVYRIDVKLEIAVKDSNGQYQAKETWEAYPFVKGDATGISYAVNHADNGSIYVTLDYNDATTSTLAADLIPADVTTWTCLLSGADGTAAIDSNWNTLSTSVENEDFTIMLAPESTSVVHNDNMVAFTTNGSKGLFYAQAANAAAESDLRTFGLQLRQTYRFGMVPCDKWIEMDDPLAPGSKKLIPAVGHLAAHYFNSYSIYGVGKVAAGNVDTLNTTDSLEDSNGLVHNDSGGVGDRLIRKNSINIVQFRSGKGVTVNSARTLSTDTGYIFQNQIVGFLLLKKSILSYLQTIEQDPAGYDAQIMHRNAIWSYLKKKYDAGVFFKGQKEDGSKTTMEDVVQVVNDFSVNTLADIANGIETNFVQVIFAPPIEEPILDLASAPVTMVSSS